MCDGSSYEYDNYVNTKVFDLNASQQEKQKIYIPRSSFIVSKLTSLSTGVTC